MSVAGDTCENSVLYAARCSAGFASLFARSLARGQSRGQVLDIPRADIAIHVIGFFVILCIKYIDNSAQCKCVQLQCNTQKTTPTQDLLQSAA